MKHNKTIMQKIATHADALSASLPRVPVIEIANDHRVLIENHNGVTEYGNTRICIKVCYGYVSVCGTKLELAQITKEQLVILGRIDTVSICREGT